MRQLARRRESNRVLRGDDPRDSVDFEGSPEYLLLEAQKTAVTIVQSSECILNTLDKTITTDKKESDDFLDIRDVGEVIRGIDKALVESINAKRDQFAIKLASIEREGIIFNECSKSEKSEVKSDGDLLQMPEDYFRLQSDVRSFDLKRPAKRHFVFQSMNSYTFVVLRELIPVVERVYNECFNKIQLLIQYCDMVFAKLIPELEKSFFHCKLDSNNLQSQIERLKKNSEWIDWADSEDFMDILKSHNNDFLKQVVDKLMLCINQSVERMAVLKVMHPVNNSDDLSPIFHLLWDISDNMFRPLLFYIEQIKAQVGNQNATDNVAVKRGFSYVCDRIITEYRSVHPEKTAIGAPITRERRSSDTTAKPSFGIDLSEGAHTPSPRREVELFVRRDPVKLTGSVSSQSPRKERGKSIDQGRAIPIPPKLNLTRLSVILEEPEQDQQTDDSDANQTKSLTRSGKLAGLFSVSPRKKPPGLPGFTPSSDGDHASRQVVIPSSITLARGSLSNQTSEYNSADLAKLESESLTAVISTDVSEERWGTAEESLLRINSEELDEAEAMLKQMAGSLDL